MSQFSYTFRLTSSMTKINLPQPILGQKRLKVKFLRYVTGSSGNRMMLIKISQFNSNYYYDGSEIIRYAKAIALPPSTTTPVIYENTMTEPDVEIVERTEKNGISTVTIEVLIDGVYSSDININNPLILEIFIY